MFRGRPTLLGYVGANRSYFDTAELFTLTLALLDEGFFEEEKHAAMEGNQIHFFQKYLLFDLYHFEQP